ncbi:MAG TPA: DUF4928 family protein [Thermodesulfobacteriota bacterium]|nr:DUF4928 family protein [Thermodesulfobacteriota bacterium]
MKIYELLHKFALDNKMKGKGPLSVALVVTRHAKEHGLPIKSDELLTEQGGQVKNLGKARVQSILKDYDIERVLAQEGGRTSRGSIGKTKKYLEFLNDLHQKGEVDLAIVEQWWIERVKEYFAAKPFILNFDTYKSIRSVIHNLLDQAQKRQSESPGTTFVGTMLQHLVGAKLSLIMDKAVEHHGASVADESSKRDADFLIEDVAIHVTVFPTDALMQKCTKNLDKSLKPIIITINKGVASAEGYADQMGIRERIDVFEAEQFLAGNLYELGKFAQSGRRTTAEQLVSEYNRIIDMCETDPSLRIQVSQ